MQTLKFVRHFRLLSLVLTVSVMPAVAQDMLFGSWRLDTGKSTFSPGPAPKSQNLRFDRSDGQVKLTLIESGTVAAISKFDFSGKRYPVEASAVFNFLSATTMKTQDSGFAFQVVWNPAAKTSLLCNGLIPAGGQMLSIVTTGTDDKGRQVNNRRVFIREK